MKQQLFRKKSLDKVTSPEQLNQYIRVSNPGMWSVLLAVVILLVGITVWGFVAKLDTTIPTAIIANNGDATIYVNEEDAQKLSKDMIVRVNDKQYPITAISSQPILIDGSFSEYAVYASGLTKGQWVYTAKIGGNFRDGVYKADIVIESISPISFILN